MRFALAMPSSLLAMTLALPAQIWTETGDAGELPGTAQTLPGTITTLTQIDGAISGDVDMYLIDIVDPAAFTATTVAGATFDTQLFLFHLDGRGVTHNDDSAATAQSSITGVNVPYAGSYLLAVSGYNNDPLAAGNTIWANSPFGTERRPDGPRRGECVDAWGGGGAAGSYSIFLTGCTRAGKTVVVPDNHHFSESTTQAGFSGSTTWWRGGGGRFQVLYEASHFLNSGLTGPTWIDQVMFRGEGGEPNLGGHQWANVTVQLAQTTMTPAGLTTNFANNLAAAASTSAVANFATVTMSRSLGGTPNNYSINLNLYSAIFGFLYDPTQGNLLVDVTMPTAATLPPGAGSVMPIDDTAGAASFIRGSGVTTSSAISATGTLNSTPPVIGFKIDGAGGSPAPIVARNEFYGAACGGAPSTFYQLFLNGQNFDITGLTLTPDNAAAPNFYTVTGGAGAFDGTKVNVAPNSTVDDGTVSHPLGFTFAFPGGSATSVSPCTNGYVWLDGVTTNADWSPTVGELLGATTSLPARLMPFWYDFNAGRNTATHPNSGLHVLTDTSGGPGNAVCYVTWLNVGAFNTVSGTGVGGHAVYNMQCVISQATGVVEFRYAEMPPYCSNTDPDPAQGGFVGFTRGRIGATPSVNPQSRDLSIEVPFSTAIEGSSGNVGQRVVATPDVGGVTYNGRAFAGQTLKFDAFNVPAGALCGAQLLDFAVNRPGISIPGIHAPGCVQGVSLSPILHEITFFPPSTVTGTVGILVPPGAEGFDLYAQYALLDGLFGGPNLVSALSNPVRVRVGRD